MNILRLVSHPVDFEISSLAKAILTCHNESKSPVHLANYVPERYLYIVKLETSTAFEAISQ